MTKPQGDGAAELTPGRVVEPGILIDTVMGTTADDPDARARREPAPEPTAEWPPRAPGPPRAGSTIGHYELIRLLGEGGMGTVFLARDTKLGRLVALKVLTRLTGLGSRRFLAEARFTARCKHENIVIIHEIDEHDGHPYMVLEYIKGQSLRDWMKERRTEKEDPEAPMAPVPPSRAVELMVPVVRALSCAHERGIVHRDLKPDNVMLDALGPIKVLDFGIAMVWEDDCAPALTTDDIPFTGDFNLTPEGRNIGTRAFMSPEQWGKDQVDARSDLWAVGIMLYELVTGAHPLASRSWYGLAFVPDLDVPMPRVSDACPDLGPLAAVIDSCLHKRKADRVGSAEELLADLEALLPGQKAFELGSGKNPFTGLTEFEEADAACFFGRERDVTRAMGQLRRRALLAIAGPSGAGKSSFVRAGLIPALKRSGEGWEAFIVRPGRHPLAALAALCAQLAPEAPSVEGTQVALSVLRDEPGYLGSVLRAHCRKATRRVLLLIDQFEELYTLGADQAERTAFSACLIGAADDISSPLRVVLAIRSDFLDRTAEDRRLTVEVTSGLSRLLPMGRDELRDALTRPIKAAGHAFESTEMVERILGELERTSSPLPLLQFTAAKLWEARDRERRLLTLESYEQLGGVAGALSTHADAILAGLSSMDQRLCRGVFLRLCTPERTRAVVSLAELRELAEDGSAVERVVQLLSDARLLLLQTRDEGTMVELCHESLIERWAKLAQWLDESKQDAHFLARLRAAAREWEASGKAQGLLWHDRAARDARAWLERRRVEQATGAQGELGAREESYALAVVALAERSRRLRRRIAAGVLATLGVVALIVSLLAVRAKREAARALHESIRVTRAQQAALQAADFAAHRVAELTALQMDRYRAAVEAAGRDPIVVRAAADPGSSRASEACAGLLAKDEGPSAGPFATWFLLDAAGTMLGIAPYSARELIGRSFAFRDYFIGAEEHDGRRSRAAYVSPVYRSESDDDYEIGISFPVHDDANRKVGILVATFPTGSTIGAIEFSDAGGDDLTAALLSPRGKERAGAPDPEPIFILHRRLGRGKKLPVGPDELLGSGFVRRAPVRDTPFFVLVSLAHDGPLVDAAPPPGRR